jgi:hypothetical protein
VPKLDGPKKLAMTDRVSLPMARLVWPTVPVNHPDEPALDMLASVLGQLDKENRLFKALEYDRQLAARVSASTQNELLSGTFSVTVLARPGQTLDELVKIADAEVEKLKADGPTADEVRKAQNAEESQLILGLQSVETRADFLNSNALFRGDPSAYKKQMKALFAGGGRPEVAGPDGPAAGRRGQGHVRPLEDARGRPPAQVPAPGGGPPDALQRAGGSGRRAARTADPEPGAGGQGGRDARPRGEARAGLDDCRAADRGDVDA